MSLLQPPGLNHARPKDTTTQSPTVGVKFPPSITFQYAQPLSSVRMSPTTESCALCCVNSKSLLNDDEGNLLHPASHSWPTGQDQCWHLLVYGKNLQLVPWSKETEVSREWNALVPMFQQKKWVTKGPDLSCDNLGTSAIVQWLGRLSRSFYSAF